MAQYKDFILENVATAKARRIGIYNSNGNRVGQIPLGTLTPPTTKKKLYSFGALSDIHLQYDTAQADFQKALTYLNNTEDVEFTCICGDLTVNGTEADLTEYKNYVETYSPNTPVYAISGNHECWGGLSVEKVISTYTGKPLYYSFTQGDDVFIMVGIKGDGVGSLFTTAELQWLYETLEANRNKRCFLFQHVRPDDSCGNAFGIYPYDLWGGTEQTVFESLLKHYKNVIFFHGHSHLKFYLQYGSDEANISKKFGKYSVHIPSLAVPRDGNSTGSSSMTVIYADSEGYVIDVYENGVHLRGLDFVNEKYLPIASYWLDTTIAEISANTYTDSTGTITK
jgi:predicted phosphodiesterase